MLIEADWARAFAIAWIDAWNSADMDRILSHYAEDFEMSSPLIIERMGEPSGRLKGKDAIRPYWAIGLAATPRLRFEFVDVFCGVDRLAILYRNVNRGRLIIERLRLDEARLVVSAEALHCVDKKG